MLDYDREVSSEEEGEDGVEEDNEEVEGVVSESESPVLGELYLQVISFYIRTPPSPPFPQRERDLEYQPISSRGKTLKRGK